MAIVNKTRQLQAFLTGSVAGSLGSAVGLGGAFIALPVLAGPLGLSQQAAAGTSMLMVLMGSAGACVAYATADPDEDSTKSGEKKIEPNVGDSKTYFGLPNNIGNIHIPTVAAFTLVTPFTTILGARVSKKLSAKYLKIAMGCVMVGVSPLIPLKSKILESKKLATGDVDSPCSKNEMPSLSALLALGTGTGFLGGLMGVGGGAIIVPALSVLSDMDYKMVLGTSLAAIMPTAITGSIAHFHQGTMVLRLGLPLGVGSLIGAFWCGEYVKRLDNEVLQHLFTAMMFILGARNIRGGLSMK